MAALLGLAMLEAVRDVASFYDVDLQVQYILYLYCYLYFSLCIYMYVFVSGIYINSEDIII